MRTPRSGCVTQGPPSLLPPPRHSSAGGARRFRTRPAHGDCGARGLARIRSAPPRHPDVPSPADVMMDDRLADVNRSLPGRWQAKATNTGRIYYINHQTQTTQWLPPPENWKPEDNNGLPYGWETALDSRGKQYYINHVEKITTREDPRDEQDYNEPLPEPRHLELIRDPNMGFGFVAGSEKPVIVRFVTEDGPSDGKLLPGDQILQINNEDVEKAPRERVIELVKSCEDTMKITVCQPHIDNSARKSALLTAAKKARLKVNPSRVRFAEAVTVNGGGVISPSKHESYIPFMPNVLKVFLENGQTKSFRYDTKTTVKDVILSLQEKLNITAINHFALVLQNTRNSGNRLSILQEDETLAEIASRPESPHFKCLFRVAFVPNDAYHLLQTDSLAFDYFFTQCTNDVVEDRFASELKYDTVLKLAALHIQQHYIASHSMAKLNLKNLQRDTGLERFVPNSVLQSTKPKELRKLLGHYLKVNEGLASGQKQLTELQAKLHYLKILSQLKAFGGKVFMATFVEKKTEIMIVVGPKQGIAEVTNIKCNTFSTLAKFSDIDYITLTKESESVQQISLHLQNECPFLEVTFSMLNDDIEDFIALVEGYYRLFVDADRALITGEHVHNNNAEADVPSYSSKHQFVKTPWNCIDGSDISTTIEQADNRDEELKTPPNNHGVVDLTNEPPSYEKESSNEDDEKHEEDAKDAIVIQNSEYIATEVESNVTAPLASPDVSTVSESSTESSSLLHKVVDSDIGLNEAVHSGTKDITSPSSEDEDFVTNDSNTTAVTSLSVQSHVSASSDSPGGSTPTLPMSRSVSTPDSRFGVSSFKTFAASPRSSPVLPRSQAVISSVMGGESKYINITATNPVTDLRKNDAMKLGDKCDAELCTEEIPVSESEEASLRIAKEDALSESDTESLNTPTASPAKLRLATAELNIAENQQNEQPHSFGLHSPEVVPPDSIHPSYNTRLFSDGQLYFDPEIIDLTLIPPPLTPEEKDTLMDFSSPTVALPPPEFKDRSSSESTETAGDIDFVTDLPQSVREKIDSIVQNGEDLSKQMAVIDELVMAEISHSQDKEKEAKCLENGSDSGNETISSENVELGQISVNDTMDVSSLIAAGDQKLLPDLDTLDIDSFIASMIVPPPPTTDNSINVTDATDTSGMDDLSVEHLLNENSSKIGNIIETSIACFSPSHQSVLSDLHMVSTLPQSTDKCAMLTSDEKCSHDDVISELLGGGDFLAVDLDEEIAKLVTPPPPDTSEIILTNIPVVPPVSQVQLIDDEQDRDEMAAEILPYDSPTALEGTRLVENLRAEYESRLGSNYPTDDTVLEHTEDSASRHETVKQLKLSNQLVQSHDVSEDKSATSSGGVPTKEKWWPTLVSKSADSSPLHQRSDSAASIQDNLAALQRIIRKSRCPPPPPPRRSSIQSQIESITGESNENLATVRPHPVVHQRSFSVPEDSSIYPHSSSTNSHSAISGTVTPTRSYLTDKSKSKNEDGNITSPLLSKLEPNLSPADEIISRYGSVKSSHRSVPKVKGRCSTIERDVTGLNATQCAFATESGNLPAKSATLDRDRIRSLQDMFQVSRSADNINLQAFREYKRSVSSPSSDSVRSSPSDSSTRFQAFKSKLKSYVAPSIYRKQQIFNRASSKDRNGKPFVDSELHKSEYLSTSVSSSPRPTSKYSSMNHRIGAFSDLSRVSHPESSTRNSSLIDQNSLFVDSTEAKSSPKTFKTFLGEKSDDSLYSCLKSTGSKPTLSDPKSKEQFASSAQEVPLTAVNVSLGNTEEIQTQQDSVTIPKGKILKVPSSGELTVATNGASQNTTALAQTSNTDASTRSVAKNIMTSSKVSALKSELESKLDHAYFVKKCSQESAACDYHKQMLNNLEMFTRYVQSHEYSGDTVFVDANNDVDHMVGQLTELLNRRSKQVQDTPCKEDLKACKDSLIGHSRTFVTDSKLLVSSATQSKTKLIHHVNTSIHTLAKIMYKSGQIITFIHHQENRDTLGSKVKDVARAYKITVEAAADAAGKALSDPNMKILMKQATSLAAILSLFMKTLKALDTQ